MLRNTEDAHDATFDFGRGQSAGLGWSDPTFDGFQPPKDFVGSLQPSTLVAWCRFAAQGRDKQFVVRAALRLESEKEDRTWHF